MASASGVQPWRFLTLTGAPCANNNWMQSEWNQSFTLYAMWTKCHILNTQAVYSHTFYVKYKPNRVKGREISTVIWHLNLRENWATPIKHPFPLHADKRSPRIPCKQKGFPGWFFLILMCVTLFRLLMKWKQWEWCNENIEMEYEVIW